MSINSQLSRSELAQAHSKTTIAIFDKAVRSWSEPTSFILAGDPTTPAIGTRYLLPSGEPCGLFTAALRFVTGEDPAAKSPLALLQSEGTEGYLLASELKTVPFQTEISERWAFDLWKRSRHFIRSEEVVGHVRATAVVGTGQIAFGTMAYCPIPPIDPPEGFELPSLRLAPHELLYPLLSLLYREWQKDKVSEPAQVAILKELRLYHMGEDRLRQILIGAGIHIARPKARKSTNQKQTNAKTRRRKEDRK